jgi:hypothetical protein
MLLTGVHSIGKTVLLNQIERMAVRAKLIKERDDL